MTTSQTIPPTDGFVFILDLIDCILGPTSQVVFPVDTQGYYAPDIGIERAKLHLITVDKHTDATGTWRSQLAAVLQEQPASPVVINVFTVPQGVVSTMFEEQRISGASAFLLETIQLSIDGQCLAALMPMSLLSSESDSKLRAWIGRSHKVEWIIYLSNRYSVLGQIHHAFEFCVLVLRIGKPDASSPQIARLLDLRGVEPHLWVELAHAASKRGGGEANSAIVLRSPVFDEGRWIYERYSKRREEALQDAAVLGPLKSLGSLVAEMDRGVHLANAKRMLLQAEDEKTIPPGSLPCLGGRSIGTDGRITEWRSYIPEKEVHERLVLAEGDVVIRAIGNIRSDRKALVAAVVTDDVLPATFDHGVIRLRWLPDIPRLVQNLLLSYLNSEHVRTSLISAGVGLYIDKAVLMNLYVPYPSEEVIAALSNLAFAQSRYLEWARQVTEAAQELFAASNYAATIPRLIERERVEQERLRAAEDSLRLDHQIKNYYPHPIALRRELLLQETHGKERLGLALECAEYLITVLGLMSMAQVADKHDVSVAVPSKSLRAAVRQGRVHMDWGKWEAIVQEAVAFTDKQSNPLVLPFPALTELVVHLKDTSSRWAKAEGQLRRWRNDVAHLQRRPEDELESMSEQATSYLDEMFELCSFLTRTPLVYVEDYALDPLTKQRRATLRVLQGVSLAFRRFTHSIANEVSRGAVGFLDHSGSLVPLTPWLIMEPCPVCKRNELFVFSRYEREEATFIAMETGHVCARPDLSLVFKAIFAGTS